MNDGHRVRVAMKGWNRSQAATTPDEVSSGVMMPWVEIDGVKYDAVTHAEFHADEHDFSRLTVTIGVLGPVDLVYLGPDGEELVSEPGDVAGDRFDSETMRERQAPSE
jgi:hypothetical protein